jgi:anti-sigma regulatory factor (Ser/Thr protein kinase)
MTYRYKKTINEFELNTLNQQVESFCESHDVAAIKLFSIQLIIEELVTNIIKYGRGNGDKATIEVELKVDGDDIGLSIADNAAAFNPLEQEEANTNLPLEERDVGGLGLFLVRKKVKSLSYEHKDGFNVLKAVI